MFPKKAFHVLKKILGPYSRFCFFLNGSLSSFSVPAFSKNVSILDFRNFDIYKIKYVIKCLYASLFSLGVMESPKIRKEK